MLGHVRDMGRDMKKDMHARGYQTASLLPFHNNSCDVVGLCCLEAADRADRASWRALLPSTTSWFARAPTLRRHSASRSASTGGARNRPARSPITSRRSSSGTRGGCSIATTASTSKSAQRHDDVPRLSKLQVEALDAVDGLCADRRFQVEMNLERGDMQFVNNYVVLHSRTAYEDEADEIAEAPSSAALAQQQCLCRLPQGAARSLRGHGPLAGQSTATVLQLHRHGGSHDALTRPKGNTFMNTIPKYDHKYLTRRGLLAAALAAPLLKVMRPAPKPIPANRSGSSFPDRQAASSISRCAPCQMS